MIAQYKEALANDENDSSSASLGSKLPSLLQLDENPPKDMKPSSSSTLITASTKQGATSRTKASSVLEDSITETTTCHDELLQKAISSSSLPSIQVIGESRLTI